MSWCVVRSRDDVDYRTPIEVIGAFATEEEAKAYALRSFYLGRDTWEHLPVSSDEFTAVPWTSRGVVGKDYFKGEVK